MREGLKINSQPSESEITPDVKYLNTLVKLEAEKKELEAQLNSANEEEKAFLNIRLEEIIKRIENYHQSFGKYRRTEKINTLKEDAGESTVAEAFDFKAGRKQDTEDSGLGKNFKDSLDEFKRNKRGSANN